VVKLGRGGPGRQTDSKLDREFRVCSLNRLFARPGGDAGTLRRPSALG